MFRQQVSAIAPHNRIEVHQAGVDDTLGSPYGWRARTTRGKGQRLGHRPTRVSMAAAWCNGSVLAPLPVEGYGAAQRRAAGFAPHLVKAWQPGQTVLVEQASFQRMESVRALDATMQCSLLPPPCSPDRSAIAPGWNQLKHTIMLDARPHPAFRHSVVAVFL